MLPNLTRLFQLKRIGVYHVIVETTGPLTKGWNLGSGFQKGLPICAVFAGQLSNCWVNNMGWLSFGIRLGWTVGNLPFRRYIYIYLYIIYIYIVYIYIYDPPWHWRSKKLWLEIWETDLFLTFYQRSNMSTTYPPNSRISAPNLRPVCHMLRHHVLLALTGRNRTCYCSQGESVISTCQSWICQAWLGFLFLGPCLFWSLHGIVREKKK